MITPVAFQTIGYQTYIIFAVINAFIVPCVYFFYPGKCSSVFDRHCSCTYIPPLLQKPVFALLKKWMRSSATQRPSSTLSVLPATHPIATASQANSSSTTSIPKPLPALDVAAHWLSLSMARLVARLTARELRDWRLDTVPALQHRQTTKRSRWTRRRVLLDALC